MYNLVELLEKLTLLQKDFMPSCDNVVSVTYTPVLQRSKYPMQPCLMKITVRIAETSVDLIVHNVNKKHFLTSQMPHKTIMASRTRAPGTIVRLVGDMLEQQKANLENEMQRRRHYALSS